jgi:hypothetical protein
MRAHLRPILTSCRVTCPSHLPNSRSMLGMDTHIMTSRWSTDTTSPWPLCYSLSRTSPWTTSRPTSPILHAKALLASCSRKATTHIQTSPVSFGRTRRTPYLLTMRSMTIRYRGGVLGICSRSLQISLVTAYTPTLTITSRDLHSAPATLHAPRTTSRRTAAQESIIRQLLVLRAITPSRSRPSVQMPIASVGLSPVSCLGTSVNVLPCSIRRPKLYVHHSVRCWVRSGLLPRGALHQHP